MQRLFTPWRFSYISESVPEDGCFFCEAARHPDDPSRLVVYMGNHHMVMLNKYPYTNGHLLIAPLRHIADPLLAGADENAEFWPLVLRTQEALDRAYKPQGFNMGMNLGRAGGAGVPSHFHYHVVPRWEGDTNFMTVLGEVRLVPEEPASALERLRPIFQEEQP